MKVEGGGNMVGKADTLPTASGGGEEKGHHLRRNRHLLGKSEGRRSQLPIAVPSEASAAGNRQGSKTLENTEDPKPLYYTHAFGSANWKCPFAHSQEENQNRIAERAEDQPHVDELTSM